MKRELLISVATLSMLMVGCNSNTTIEEPTDSVVESSSESIGISSNYVQTMSESEYLSLINEYSEVQKEIAVLISEVFTIVEDNPVAFTNEEWQDLFEQSITLLSSQCFELIHLDPLSVPESYRDFHESYTDAIEDMLLSCSHYLEMVEHLREGEYEMAAESLTQGTHYLNKANEAIYESAELLD